MFAFAQVFLGLLALASFGRATLLIKPLTFVGNTSYTIRWSFDEKDPNSFDIELSHPSFNSDLALGNNVPTAEGLFTATLPSVPIDNKYTILFTAVGNINLVYAQIGPIAVVEHDVNAPLPTAFAPTTVPLTTAVPTPKTTVSPSTLQPSPTPTAVGSAPSSPNPASVDSTAGTIPNASSAPKPSSAAVSFVPSASLIVLAAGIFAVAF